VKRNKRKMNFQACVVIFIALAAIYGCNSVQISVSDDPDTWDYLLMVSRWPGTVGYGTSLPPNVTQFTLHGLWPTRNDGSWPQYCNDSQPFSPSEIESLVPELWVGWYDFQSNGFDFWSHEWDKHGTCAENDSPLDSEFNYFSMALKLIEQYNPLKALQAANITASDSYWYSLTDIETAVSDYYGVTPNISCQSVGSVGDSLDIIQFCITKDFKLEQCPTSMAIMDSTSCSSHVYVPEIQYK